MVAFYKEQKNRQVQKPFEAACMDLDLHAAEWQGMTAVSGLSPICCLVKRPRSCPMSARAAQALQR